MCKIIIPPQRLEPLRKYWSFDRRGRSPCGVGKYFILNIGIVGPY